MRRSRDRRLGLKMVYCYSHHQRQSLAFPLSERQSSAHTSRRKSCLWSRIQQSSTLRIDSWANGRKRRGVDSKWSVAQYRLIPEMSLGPNPLPHPQVHPQARPQQAHPLPHPRAHLLAHPPTHPQAHPQVHPLQEVKIRLRRRSRVPNSASLSRRHQRGGGAE